MEASANRKFDVGGVVLDRPFKISRLGHFGYFTDHMTESKRFYLDLLGFEMSDPLDFARRVPPEMKGQFETVGYFTRFNGDHHAFVLFPRRFFEVMAKLPPQHVVNQITWQVGSLKQVVDASQWLASREVDIDRSGRDMPGSNWHTYMRDPEGSRNELYYGMEQIGWIGRSKPLPMHNRRFTEAASLPQIPEWKEVDDAVAAGVDLLSGVRNEEKLPPEHNVGGILLSRPFKITSIGPVRLLVEDVQKVADFYTGIMGFDVTEEVTWKGHRCLFLRCNTDHHCVSIYPLAVAKELELPRQGSRCFSFGVKLYDYQQVKDSVAFLQKNGVKILHLPPELFPGMDYTAFAVDPDGHLVQLYYYMEQIGWDGKPKPAHLRRKVDNANWPETVQALSDTFNGEPYLGPWG